MEQTSYVWVKFFGNVKIAKRNNFQITSRHFQVTPTFRISSPRLIGGALIQLFNFSHGAYWMWSRKRCLALIRIFLVVYIIVVYIKIVSGFLSR